MIDFSCSKCDKKYSVSAEYAGKKARCKQCNHANVIPPKGAQAAVAELIPIKCGKCSHKMSVKGKYAGKRLRCPKCGNLCTVPVPGSDGQVNSPADSNVSFSCGKCGLDLSAKEGMRGQSIECGGCGSLAEVPYKSGGDSDCNWDYDPSLDDDFADRLAALGVDAKNAEEIEMERPKKSKASSVARHGSSGNGGFLKKLFGG